MFTPIVESTYLNRDMCKFESSQKDESIWQSTDSSKAYRNISAFECEYALLAQHCHVKISLDSNTITRIKLVFIIFKIGFYCSEKLLQTFRSFKYLFIPSDTLPILHLAIILGRVGTWSFCSKIVKTSPFSKAVWPQIFCLAFWRFWVFLKIWPNFALICMCYQVGNRYFINSVATAPAIC